MRDAGQASSLGADTVNLGLGPTRRLSSDTWCSGGFPRLRSGNELRISGKFGRQRHQRFGKCRWNAQLGARHLRRLAARCQVAMSQYPQT